MDICILHMDEIPNPDLWGKLPFPYEDLSGSSVDCDFFLGEEVLKGPGKFLIHVRNDLGIASISVIRDHRVSPGSYVTEEVAIPVVAFHLIQKPSKYGSPYLLHRKL
jgi:hypothetical protein